MKDNTVRSLERGLAVLQCFDLDTEELSLTQMAERLNLPPSTVLRLASALTQLGFLEKSRAKTYSLGNKVFLLGTVAHRHFKLRRIILPVMQALRDATNETVSLYALEDGMRVCYEHVESHKSMRYVVRVGDKFPLWAGAAGKCLLAFTEPEFAERQIDASLPVTKSTIIDKKRFLDELARIRETEEAISYGEREEGIVAVAVPIFTAKNQVNYALSLAAPFNRLKKEALPQIIRQIKEAACTISRQLYS